MKLNEINTIIFFIFYLIFVIRFIVFFYFSIIIDKKNNKNKNNLLFKYKLSIIIPVRNEEKNILNLLNSLLEQNYKDFEIIIIDDNSIDNTELIIKNFIKNNKKEKSDIKIFYHKLNKEKEPFKNWEGKSAACYYGALLSSNDYLLFIDADVFLQKDSLEYLLEHYDENEILTIQPFHYTKKLYENLSLVFNTIAFVGMDLGKIYYPNYTKNGLFGPFILISKKIYFSTNGHLNVKDIIIEDIMLGILFSKLGYKIKSIPHKKKIFYRMYPNKFKDLIDGWTKNISSGALKTNIFTFLIITSFIAFSISNNIYLFKAIIKKNNILFYGINYFIFVLTNFFLIRNLGNFSFINFLIFPIHLLFFLIIFIRSFIMKIFKIPVYWKNRKILIK